MLRRNFSQPSLFKHCRLIVLVLRRFPRIVETGSKVKQPLSAGNTRTAQLDQRSQVGHLAVPLVNCHL